jgi:hypothetical protein
MVLKTRRLDGTQFKIFHHLVCEKIKGNEGGRWNSLPFDTAKMEGRSLKNGHI